MGEKNSINKRCKLTRPVMSPAKIVGDWGNVRDNLQSLKYQQPQQFWGKEKAYSKWIIITWITSVSFFFSPFTEVMIPIRGIIRFICFSTFSVTVLSCLCWLNLFGTLTYFQEQDLYKKISCREGSLPPHSYPPPLLIPILPIASSWPSATSTTCVPSAPCFWLPLPELVFLKISRCFLIFLLC